MGTLPGARTTEESGPSTCPSGWASLSPLPEEGVFKGVDLLVSITPPGLPLPLILSLWKPGISFQGPHSNQPCFHGDPTIPHQLPSCHNNSRDYQLFPQPQALCYSPLRITSVPPLSVALVIKAGGGNSDCHPPPCEVWRGPKHQGVCSAFLLPFPRR